MENEKTRTKSYYQANKEKLLRRSHEYYRNLPEDEKLKAEIVLTLQISICQTQYRKKKRMYEILLL